MRRSAAYPAARSRDLEWGREPRQDKRDRLKRSRPVDPRCERPDPGNSLRGEAEVRLGGARSPGARCGPTVPGGGDSRRAFRPTEGRGPGDWPEERKKRR
ncbi:hypothetical protein NDU88_001434 [Pleurodeles waltl]|uniref:Uncharacterized protein n=1 Tax=Pleurodeles waltl TaxID=8319 RepID=A0AAV7TIP6_PLEWA|nr:hypothetical protein NDU88_001434 [Pleurodeles waltl]